MNKKHFDTDIVGAGAAGLSAARALQAQNREFISSALPGCVDQRTALGKCLEEKLFFAGEAVIPQHYATVHGACISGQKAAADV